ncbi:MAG: pirin family protein [Solirubrobacterales bacterium]
MNKGSERGRNGIEIRRADTRIPTDLGWLEARGSFPMGHHPRDPENTHFGLLYVHQEDRIAPQSGFPTHPHRQVEVVTWILEGALEHRDDTGGQGVIRPGQAQHMSAGTGVQHSEMNPFGEEAHVVQMWVAPDEAGGDPYYADVDVAKELAAGGLVAIASGRLDDPPARLRQKEATLWAARLDASDSVDLPGAPFVHVFVTRGAVHLDGETLRQGDAARLRAAGVMPVSGAEDGSELLTWEMHAELTVG